MYAELLTEQLQANINAMYLLIAWAVLNIIGGLIMAQSHNAKPVLKNFFLMNAFWNIGNLILGVSGFLYLSAIAPADIDLKSLLYTVFSFEKLLVLNAGLNIAYIAIGSYLVERGLHHKRSALQGYGKSLWLQGAFMLVFSLVLYCINTMFNQRYSIFILF